MAKYVVTIEGYYADEVRKNLPHSCGIYFVLASRNGNYRLLYIGKAKEETINQRVINHERHDDFVNSCCDGESLFYAWAELDNDSIDIVENALIYSEKPPLNTELVNQFNYVATEIETSGYNSFLNHRNFLLGRRRGVNGAILVHL